MRILDWNQDWHFSQEGTERNALVTLPHDAMIHTPRAKEGRTFFLLAGFEGGNYVYTKSLAAPADWQGKTVFLELESVYCNSQVFVNGALAYEKPYGYTPFQVDLTPYLRIGAENEIRVVARVPKTDHSRWYSGGGIPRPVHLMVGGEAYIRPWGVKITTLSIHPARVRVDVAVVGRAEVEITLAGLTKMVAAENGKAAAEFEIPEAKLWSAETPNLYTAQVRLMKNGAALETVEEEFGIRTVSVNPEQGLLINGVPTFLRGGCIHIDNGVIGVVNNNATELRRARNIKAAGFNAVRSAHHPMSRSLMRACDRVGLYVMDEAFDYWYRPKVMNPHRETFLDTFREDTRAMVHNAYNHPSVIMYSIGNEIPEAGGVKGVRIGKAILEEIHSIDTTRLTTLCPSVHWLREYLADTPYLTVDEDEWLQDPAHREEDWKHYMKIFMGADANIPENEKGLAYPPTYIRMDEDATKNLYPCLDVAGYNYMEDRYQVLHDLHPERVILGTETRGKLLVDTMRYAREHPFLIGDFVWTLQDHLGESNCSNWHYGEEDKGRDYPWLINCGGVLDLLGQPLPGLHQYHFAWDESHRGLFLAAQPPVCGGKPPVFNEYRLTDSIESWSFEGCQGRPTFVDAITDAASVEIFVNGRSVGRAEVQDFFAKIPCIYEPGELMGVGYDEKGRELYRTVLRTAGPGTRITAKAHKTQMQSGGEDFCFIDIAITDETGTVKALPERQVTVQIQGDAALEGFGSADPKNEASYNSCTHQTYYGRLQAVLRSGRSTGPVKVRICCEDVPDHIIEVRQS